MRTLVILRGSPGSGKSTWVKKMGLENYTLSPDNLRILVESPILTPEENYRVISQSNDGYVWSLLFDLLEKRMQKGEFTIIDATHSRSSDFSRYNKLCERYRYRKYYVDFSDVPIDECKKRNKSRESYKIVPDSVIEKIYSRLKTQQKTSGWVEVDKNNFWNEIGTKLYDLNRYNTIHIFGDIHGCYNPLKFYFDSYGYNENDFYIFTGDYIDRGLQNKETLEFLMTFVERSNVLFLEGNHEKWLNYYSLEEYENIKSKTFMNKTAIELNGINKKDIKKFYRKLGQMAYFKYDNHIYIVSHGGLNYLPEELQLVSTNQMINGVGDYNIQIDEIFSKNEKNSDVIQVHGHRNTFKIDNENKSYNLEGNVEFGGELRVLQLQQSVKPLFIKIKNDYFGKPEEVNEFAECKSPSRLPIVEQLRLSKYIREKDLGNNISSFNFTRDAFFNRKWNDLTCKARGLFVDTSKDKVVARGYEKFFNINEVESTKLEHLLQTFKGRITCYKKENGFLGIMSYVNGKLFLSSKSSNEGEFADYFKFIFEQSDIDKSKLEDYLKNNDVSLTFEVIDTKNDPHIIKYDNSKIVLLDIIHNDYKFNKESYENVKKLAKEINCECKTIYAEFDNVRDFHKWYLENTNENNMSHNDIEGVVIENNGFMTKLKFPYYNFWKFMRRVKEQVAHKSIVKLSSLYNAKSNYFYAWLKEQDKEVLEKDIIYLREKFEGEFNGKNVNME